METEEYKSRFDNVVKILTNGNKSEFSRLIEVSPQNFARYRNKEIGIGMVMHEKLRAIGINSEYIKGISKNMFADNEAGAILQAKHGGEMSATQKQGVQFQATIDPIEDIRIPLMTSPARAGVMSWASGDVESYVSVKKYHHAGSFYVMVQGDSMIGAGIEEGMRALVDTTIEPRTGMIVLAQYADTENYTIKRLKRNGKDMLLHPDNPDYEPITVNENIVIRGVITKAERVFL